MIEMRWIRYLCVCALLCSSLTTTAAKWDDTVAPLTVVEPADTDNTTFNFHMAHFGQVPYGSVIEGYAPHRPRTRARTDSVSLGFQPIEHKRAR